MKNLTIFVVFCLIYGCAFDKEDHNESTKQSDSWLSRAKWRASTLDEEWNMLSNNPFKGGGPVICEMPIKAQDYHFAFDIYDGDSTLGSFDSIVVSYKSNIDLYICSAIRWHDNFGDDLHGFEVKPEIDKKLTTCTEFETQTFYASDFGTDWYTGIPMLDISQSNNFGIGNVHPLADGDTIRTTIRSIEIYR